MSPASSTQYDTNMKTFEPTPEVHELVRDLLLKQGFMHPDEKLKIRIERPKPPYFPEMVKEEDLVTCDTEDKMFNLLRRSCSPIVHFCDAVGIPRGNIQRMFKHKKICLRDANVIFRFVGIDPKQAGIKIVKTRARRPYTKRKRTP